MEDQNLALPGEPNVAAAEAVPSWQPIAVSAPVVAQVDESGPDHAPAPVGQPPPPPPPPPDPGRPDFDRPDLSSQPVVRVLSPRGIEYVFFTIALFTSAVGLVSALIALVNGQVNFNVMEFPAALMIVGLPIFAGLFLRLKKSELLNPALRYEASKRRSTQVIQIATFVVSFFTLIGFVTAVLAKMSGNIHYSMVKIFLDVVVIVGVSLGILYYYWHDEHRLN